MKNPSVFRALFALASISVLATVGGCSNFMSSDSDFKKKLTEEVKVANAPKIEVRIQADTGTGTVSPNGLTVVKVDVPFTITFQPAADYGFTGWAVFDIADPSEPLGAEIMTFVEKESPDGYTREVEARLLVNRPNLMVRPICVGRPTVTGTTPTSGRVDIVRNYPIKIFFSNKMDGAAFLFDDGSARKDGLFKNISITGLFGDPSTSEFRSYEEYYNPPTLNTTGSGNGKILTLSPVPGNLPPSYSVIRVTVKKDVKDSTGLSMAQDYIFDFTLGNSTDTKGPIMGAIQGGRAPNVYSFSTPSTRRVASGLLYLTVEADDSLTGGGFVTMLSIKEQRIKDRDGQSVSETETETGWEDAPFTAEEGTQRSKLSYVIKGSKSGIYKLTIRALDSNLNWTADADAAVYHVVKDVDAPLWDLSKVTHSGGISGVDSNIWFNGANQTLTLSPVSGGPIDVGVKGFDSGAVPGTTRSEEVWWRVSAGTSVYSSWASVTSPLTYSLAGAPESSSVSIQIELRDDLGNTTGSIVYDTIKNDKTPPAAPGVVITALTTLSSGRKMINGTPSYTITGSDAVSGAVRYLVNDTGTRPTEGSPGWASFTSQQTGTYSLSDTSEGPKTLSVWLMDNAKNISDAGTDTAYLDNQPPSIQKFYVQKVDWANKSVDPGAAPESQYTNDAAQWVNFMIKATDAGSGIGSFMYEDVCSGTTITSGYFDAVPNLAEQTSGTGAVTNIMVADLGSGVSLIFGQLKISAENGTHAVSVRVKDYVDTASLATKANDNSLFYDNVAPSFDSAPTFTGSGPGYYTSGGTLFVATTAQDVSVPLTDSGAAGAFSGLKDLVFSGAVTASHSLAASVGTQNHSQNYPVILSADYGAKTINLSASDFAGNTNTATINAFLDNAPPTISTFELRRANNTVYADYVYYNPFYAYFSASDPNTPASGVSVAATAAHKIEIYKQSDPTVAVLSKAIQYQTLTELTLGSTLSDLYTAKAFVYDRVGNVTTQEKNFHFDITPPAWRAVNPLEVVDSAGNPLGIFKGNTHYIPSTNFRIKAYVTDKPAADPAGSGLNAIRALYAVSVSGDSGNAVRSESAEVNPDDRWVYLPFNPSTNEWTALSNQRVYVTAQAFDKAGLSSWSHGPDATSSTFIVVPDISGPNITSPSRTWGQSDLQGTTRYINGDGFSCTVTIIDPGAASLRSGVKAYAFSTDGIAPSTAGVPAWNETSATYDASWATYGVTGPWYRFTGTEGIAYEIGAQLLAFLEANQGQSVYVHAIDMLGNAGELNIIDNSTDTVYVDRTSPVVSLKINRLDEASIPALVNTHIADGSSTYTTSSSVKVTVTINETGAGVKAITFIGFTPTSLDTPYAGASITSTTCDFGPVGIPRGAAVQLEFTGNIPATDGTRTVQAQVLDRVNNPAGTSSSSIIYDTIDPVITKGAWPPSSLGSGGGGTVNSYYIKSGTTVSLTATDANEVLRYVISQNATETASTIASGTVYNGAITPDISTYFNESTKTKLYFHVMDEAGRTHALCITSNDSSGFYLDATAPTISNVTVQGKVGSYLSAAAADLSLTFTATETGSGIKTIKISGVANDTTGITVNFPGYTVSSTHTWESDVLTIVLDNFGSARFPTPNGTSITVEGMTLLPNDGDKIVGVTLTDVVGFESAQVTDTFTLESTPPVLSNLWVRRGDGITGNGNDGTYTSDSYTTNQNVTINVRFNEIGSGIKTLTVSGLAADFSGPFNVTKDGAAIAASCNATGVFTFTTPQKSKATGDNISVLSISGVKLNNAGGDAQFGVSVQITDDAGGTSGVVGPKYIMLDSVKPALDGAPTLTGYYQRTGDNAWFVGSSPRVSFTGTDPFTGSEPKSGINGYYLMSSATLPASPSGGSWTVAASATNVDVSSHYDAATAKRVYVFLRDNAGNVSDAIALDPGSVIKDTQVPTFTGNNLGTLPAGVYQPTAGSTTLWTQGTSITLTPAAVDQGLSEIQGYRIGAGAIGSQVTLTASAAGTTTTVRALDWVGNPTDLSITARQDTTGPSGMSVTAPDLSTVYPRNTTLASAADLWTTLATVTVTVAASDGETNVKRVWATDDSATPVDVTGVVSGANWTLDLASGKTWTVKAENNVGLTTTWGTIPLQRDSDGGPTTVGLTVNDTITSLANGDSVTSGATVHVRGSSGVTAAFTPSATETQSGIARYYATASGQTEVSVTSAPYTLNLTAQQGSLLTWSVYAVDNLGQTSGTPFTVTLRRDDAAPASITLTPQAPGGSDKLYPATAATGTGTTTYWTNIASPGTITFAPTATEANAWDSGLLGFSLNGTETTTIGVGGTQTVTVDAAALTFTAVDNVGNIGTGPTIEVIQDVTAPTFQSTAMTMSGSPTVINVAATDNTGGSGLDAAQCVVEYSPDGSTGWTGTIQVYAWNDTTAYPATLVYDGSKITATHSVSGYNLNFRHIWGNTSGARTNGEVAYFRIRAYDNLGNWKARLVKFLCTGGDNYTLSVQGTDGQFNRFIMDASPEKPGSRNSPEAVLRTAFGEGKSSAVSSIDWSTLVAEKTAQKASGSSSAQATLLPLSVQSSPARAVPVRLDSRSVQERHTAARTERAWAETGEQSVEKQEVTEPTEALPVDSVPTSVENVARPTQTDIPASGPQQNQGGNQDAPSNPSRAPDEPNSNRQPYCLPGRGRKQEEDTIEE